MAYQTGAAASPLMLLDSIRTFLLGLGWTINYFGNDPQGVAGDDHWLSVKTPGNKYFNILADYTAQTVHTRGATGYTANNNRNTQPGQAPGWTQTNALSGPFAAYYLFGGAEYLHVVVEVVTNRFAHFHIGTLEKAGNYTGGEYQTGTSINLQPSYQNDPESVYNGYPFDANNAYRSDSYNYYRIDADGAQHNWVTATTSNGGSDATRVAQGFLRGSSSIQSLIGRSPNHLTGQAILLPSLIVGPRPAGGTAIYGTVPDVRAVNIANISPKEVVTIGSDEWMIFPIVRKGWGTQYDMQSGNYGIAYRKVI